MKKRVFALLCAAVMLFALLPMPASAVVSELGREGDWVVGVDDRYPSDYIIIGYNGKASTVTIPTKVGAWVIRGVHQFAFQDNTTVKTIHVPDGVTVYSLGGCNVETVNCSANAGVGSGAFENCAKLKTVVLPENMEAVPSSMFAGCVSLVSVDLPDGIEAIGEAAFSGCTALTELVLPDAVKEIRSRAFLNCSNLKSINIPANVETIGAEEPFGGCRNLAEIKVEDGNTVFYNDAAGNLCTDKVINSVDHVLLVRSVTGKYGDSYTIPSNITALARACFNGVGGLKKLVIPTTVNYVDGYILQDCLDLTEVRFQGRPNRLNFDVFYGAKLTAYYPGDTGQWDYEDFTMYNGEVTWIPYCTGIHKGSIGEVITPATCTQTGQSRNICDLCGEEYIYEIPVADHSYDDGEVTREAICMTNGELTYTCTVCGDFYTESIPAPGHRYDYDHMTIVDPPTCTQKGTRETFCLDCGDRWFGEAPALGHDYSEVVPVYDENGWHHDWKCVRCDSVEKTESCTFDGGSVVKEASLDDFGTTKHTCTVCGGSYETEFAYRISGKGRCETAYAAADLLKETLGVEKFDAIIIASGENFADALSGSFLAARKNAPILLFMKGYEERNLAYITENLASGGIVYILGGTASVAQSMEDALEGYTVRRLSGKSRFDTNLAILEEAGVGNEDILVCTGWNFADCLSASATGLPILLVDSKAGKLTETQTEFLAEAMDNDFVIIGGTNTVCQEIEDALRTYGEVGRLNGKSRYETSVLVAEKFFAEGYAMADPDIALLTNGQNFPDGLCGGPLAYALKAPIVLVNEKNEKAAAAYIAENGITRGVILGGSASVSDASGEIAFGLN